MKSIWMLTLVLDRIVCSHCNFNYANYKTAWEVIVMILSETSIIRHCMHIIYSTTFSKSYVVEKKDRKHCLRITASAYTAHTVVGSIIKSLCVLAHWILTTPWLPLCQLGICATERLSNLPKDTQLLSAIASVWTQAIF